MKIYNHATGEVKEYSAGFIVFNEDCAGSRKYLILKYPGGHFDFAKGHLENGEDNLQAAYRELEEETGISEIEIVEGFEEKIVYEFRRGKLKVEKTVVFFLGKTNQTDIKISDEHHGALWLEYHQAVEKVTFENAKNILINAEKYIENK